MLPGIQNRASRPLHAPFWGQRSAGHSVRHGHPCTGAASPGARETEVRRVGAHAGTCARARRSLASRLPERQSPRRPACHWPAQLHERIARVCALALQRPVRAAASRCESREPRESRETRVVRRLRRCWCLGTAAAARKQAGSSADVIDATRASTLCASTTQKTGSGVRSRGSVSANAERVANRTPLALLPLNCKLRATAPKHDWLAHWALGRDACRRGRPHRRLPGTGILLVHSLLPACCPGRCRTTANVTARSLASFPASDTSGEATWHALPGCHSPLLLRP